MRTNKIILLIAALALFSWPSMEAQKSLSFKNGKLKIAQFSDIHWDPQSPNSEKTVQSIEAVLKAERPDVAMLTGDIVTEKPALEGWKAIVSLFEKAQVPFAVTMGNHDGEVMPKEAIYQFLNQSKYFIGDRGPSDIHGFGNGVIPVYGADGQKPKALLYYLDSNDYTTDKDYGMYDWIHFDQIAWYRETSERFTRENGGQPLPALAFFHIPVAEYEAIPTNGTILGQAIENGDVLRKINSGLFTSLIEMGDVMGTFAGHNHENDFIGIHYKIALAYCRVSGIDAYGELERGARIIELTEGTRGFDSWIRTPSGKGDTFYFPSGLTSKDERTMTYLPATKLQPGEGGVDYTYFEGNFQSVDELAGAKAVKEGTMKNFSIAEAPAEDHFGYRFRSLIKIPERGVYKFHLFSDDGAKLFIDGQEVIDNDGSHSIGQATGKVALEGGFHEVELLYFEDYMGQSLEIGITGKRLPRQVIPDEMLFLPK